MIIQNPSLVDLIKKYIATTIMINITTTSNKLFPPNTKFKLVFVVAALLLVISHIA
jgi:hypothetical protein